MSNDDFHNRYSNNALWLDYDGHRIYYVAKNGRAIIVRNGEIVDWCKAGSMARTLKNARLLVDDHNATRWDAKVAEDEDRFWESYDYELACEDGAPHPYIGY